jgi:hypothetical protein
MEGVDAKDVHINAKGNTKGSCSTQELIAAANEDGGVDTLLEKADEACDVVCGARVDQDVDASARHHSYKVHGGTATHRGLCGTDHHEEAIVDVIGVVVVDGRDVEEVFALVATDEGFVAVEAEPQSATFCHLFGGETLEQT